MKAKSLEKIIRFFKKHIRFNTLDDIYTSDEKKELIAHWKAFEDEYNKSLASKEVKP